MPSFSRTCSTIVIGLSLLAEGPAAGQAGAAIEGVAGPTVDFVAVGADGTPVDDLQRSEVEVRINDRVRAVRALRRVTAAPPSLAADRSLAPPFGTNDRVAAGRAFVLVVDQESISTAHQQLIRNAVGGLLEDLTPADHVMIAALPFGGVQLPFTSIRCASGSRSTPCPARARWGSQDRISPAARADSSSRSTGCSRPSRVAARL